MTLLGGTLPSWKDFQDQYGPDGALQNFANVLSEMSGIVDDVLWQPSNKVLSHQTTLVEGLPTFARRRMNKGTASTKGTLGKQEDALTIIEGKSTMDMLGPQLYGSGLQMRRQAAKLFAESAVQKFTRDFVDGTVASDPEGIDGFAARTATLGDFVLDAGGTGGDLASIYLVGWGDMKVYGTHPKNAPGGLVHKDWGEQLVQQDTTAGGVTLPALVDQWSWMYGLVVEDKRYLVRIANVDTVDALGVSGTQDLTDYTTSIVFKMAEAIEHIWNIEACRPVFYMPRALREALKLQYLARTTANVFTFDQVDGRRVMAYEDIPIRALDAMSLAETRIEA